METAWIGDLLAVTVADIDFLDPALVGTPGARERGVRLEVRLVEQVRTGSGYASPEVRVAPALCRIDLLESAPGRADRMHWHPMMRAGEPGDRVLDPAIGADPVTWVRDRLGDVGGLLRGAGVADPAPFTADADRLASCLDDVVARVQAGLARARRPWPEVQHDERGLAPVE